MFNKGKYLYHCKWTSILEEQVPRNNGTIYGVVGIYGLHVYNSLDIVDNEILC